MTIYQLGPFLQDGYTWQISALGKYKFSGARVRPFTELGFSFLPVENRDKTGITAGSGVELPVGRVSFTPTIRYTRWVTNPELGEVANRLQFLVGIHENSESLRPTIMGRPLSLGFVVGTGITKLLKDRIRSSVPVRRNLRPAHPDCRNPVRTSHYRGFLGRGGRAVSGHA